MVTLAQPRSVSHYEQLRTWFHSPARQRGVPLKTSHVARTTPPAIGSRESSSRRSFINPKTIEKSPLRGDFSLSVQPAIRGTEG